MEQVTYEHVAISMGVRVAQAEHCKSYLGVTGRQVDKTAQRVTICPANATKAYYKYINFVAFIWELNDLRQ